MELKNQLQAIIFLVPIRISAELQKQLTSAELEKQLHAIIFLIPIRIPAELKKQLTSAELEKQLTSAELKNQLRRSWKNSSPQRS